MSIRYKIFGAFSVVIMLAGVLAFYGIRGISDSGDLVVRLFDGPLMAINHARSAHAALNEARLLMYRSSVEGTSKEAVTKFEKLIKNVNEDIAVVRERVHSPNVSKAREQAEGSLKQWSASVLKILKPAEGARRKSRPPSSWHARAMRRSPRSTISLKRLRPTASNTGRRRRPPSQIHAPR